LRRPVASREWKGKQPREAEEAVLLDPQGLSAPDGAVLAVTRAVPGEAEDRRRELVVDHARDGGSGVGRYGDDVAAGLTREPSGGIVRMAVADERSGCDGVEPAEGVDRRRERPAGRLGPEVPDVRADEDS